MLGAALPHPKLNVGLPECGLQLLDFLAQLPLTQVRSRRPALRKTSLAALQKLLLPTRDRLLARLPTTNGLRDRHLTTDDCDDKPELIFKRENRRACQR